MRLLRTGLALLLAAVTTAAFACGSEEPEPEGPQRRQPRLITEPPEVTHMPVGALPTPLHGPLQSMMTVEQATAALGAGVTVKEGRSTELEQRGHCPGQRRTTYTVADWEHVGSSGMLRLQFNDGLLISTSFQPKDYMAYRTGMQEQLSIPIRSKKKSRVPPYTLVWASPVQPISVVFEDPRMQKHASTAERACRYQRQQEGLEQGSKQAP